MATYKQIIPEFIDHDPSHVESGELPLNNIKHLFSLLFVKRHAEFDRTVRLSFKPLIKPGLTQPLYSIVIEYPNHPDMTHVIGTLSLTTDEQNTNEKFLKHTHPLLMREVYKYLQRF